MYKSIFKQKIRLLDKILCQTQYKPWRRGNIKPLKQLVTIARVLFGDFCLADLSQFLDATATDGYVRDVHGGQQCERPHQLITRISDFEPLIMSSYRVLDLGPFPWPSQCRHSSRLTFYKLCGFLFFTRHFIKTRNQEFDKLLPTRVANICLLNLLNLFVLFRNVYLCIKSAVFILV